MMSKFRPLIVLAGTSLLLSASVVVVVASP